MKKHPVLKGLLIAGLVLLVLAGALALYLWNKLDLIVFDNEMDHSIYETMTLPEDQEDELILDIGDQEVNETTAEIPEGELMHHSEVINILLIGTDERTKDFNVNARSDSMILVSINKHNNSVKLISLERAIGVPILEGKYEGQYDWLTHVFRYGGSELLTKTVEHCFKIDIDHYIRMNFHSVEEVVDAIGGIEVELTAAEASALNNTPIFDNGQKRLSSGTNHLLGSAALGFARLRSIDSDWQRVGRQRKVILAVVDKLKGSSLSTLNDLADQVLPLIQTNMTKLDIAQLMLYAPSFLTADFDQMTLPESDIYGYVRIMNNRYGFAVDYEVVNPMLREYLYGDLAK